MFAQDGTALLLKMGNGWGRSHSKNWTGPPASTKEAGRDIFRHLQKLLRPLQERLQTHSWSVESFWNPCHGKVTLLQLRLIPLDRSVEILFLPKNIFYETHFTWGGV